MRGLRLYPNLRRFRRCLPPCLRGKGVSLDTVPPTELATFFERLHLHKLIYSPVKSRIEAARVDFLGHLISIDGVRSNDDRVIALSRIIHIRSLLGGLSYYRKFLPNIACRIRPMTASIKKAPRSNSPPQWRTPFVALLTKLTA